MKINKTQAKIDTPFALFKNFSVKKTHGVEVFCVSPPEDVVISPFVFINGSQNIKKSLESKVKNSPPVFIYSADEVKLFGHGLIVDSDENRIFDHRAIPEVGRLGHGFNKEILIEKDRSFEFKSRLAKKNLDEEVDYAILSQAGQGVYGHWLVDILPRLALMESCGFDGRYILHEPIPRFGWDLIDEFGVKKNRFISFDPRNQFISIRKAWIPGSVRSGNSFSRVSLFAFQRARKYSVNHSLQKKIYVSRANFRGKNQIIENRFLLEDLAVKNDFEIIHPEKKSISEQIQIFSSAEFVAGEYGSAMHNSIFSPSSCKVLIFQSSEHPHFMQAGLCNVLGQSIGFVFGNAEKNSRNFSVNLSDAEAAFELMK